MDHWSRRQFVQGGGAAGLGLLVGCGRLPEQAQAPPPRVARIGFISAFGPPGVQQAAFRVGLQAHGYIEGENLVIEYRAPTAVAELVQLPVDLIVAVGTTDVTAAKQATNTIPNVTVASGDPVGTGFITSLAHPGGNVTGTTQMTPQLSGKRLELLKEVIPSVSRVTIFWNPADANTANQWQETRRAAEFLGVQLDSVEVRTSEEITGAFEVATSHRPEALLTLADPLLSGHASRIGDFTAQRRVPGMGHIKAFADSGGLMVYGVNIANLYQRAAYYVDRILKGAKPADLPVEQPTTFDFIINLHTAQALGLTLPPHVLLQATEVVQ
jgi:putative tryptophan/tyrosine transport system substrate-binding protein